ncbi:polysaccharide deacetylase family protein [Anaeromyxobacter paludicola]|uniref:Glycosyl transferase n=1 Tax=Anaeromyxobacter paludicola TaxID=2918171 RepID=A0ABN6NAF7_9BACT|nr:polysaccharide deacetylase family protein [Anaeromyxobacter paludicola]BDG09391.1 glycosyl transferase [Anaeromyxobacter paludicola]
MIHRRVVALMYHGLGEPADAAEGARYTVRLEELDAQLDVAAAAPGGVLDPRAPSDGPGVVLTFDDGEASVRTEALPRLAALGMRGALFMTTGFLGRPGYLDAAGLRAIHRAGWLIGAHGHTHRFLTLLEPDELHDELERSRAILSAVLGEAPVHLSLPGGRTSDEVERAARAHGFTTFWTSRPGCNASLGEGGVLRRTAIRRGTPLERFARLCRGEPLAHLADELDMGARGLVRRAMGDARYHAFTGRLLGLAGRR